MGHFVGTQAWCCRRPWLISILGNTWSLDIKADNNKKDFSSLTILLFDDALGHDAISYTQQVTTVNNTCITMECFRTIFI